MIKKNRQIKEAKVAEIREKLEKYITGNKIIQTVWGVGYKIEK